MAPVEIESDVLVIGGGIAGAMAAYNARKEGVKVVLVDKGFFGTSGASALASGTYQHYNPDYTVDEILGMHDAQFGAARTNSKLLGEYLPISYELLQLMDKWGVKWVKQGDAIVRKPGPGKPLKINALMSQGGPQFMMAVRSGVVATGVEVFNRVMINDLLTSDGKSPTKGSVIGAIGVHVRNGEIYLFRSRATVVCSGAFKFPFPVAGKGFNGMPRDLSGDGVAVAWRAGAQLSKLSVGGANLIPAEFYSAPGLELLGGLEAEGESIVWLNALGEKFMEKNDAPLDRYVRGALITRELREGRGPIFIDLTGLPLDKLTLVQSVIPIVWNNWTRGGYNPCKDRIPYTYGITATHGTHGHGIRVDRSGSSTIPGLFAGGNCSDGAWITLTQALVTASITGYVAGKTAAQYSNTVDLQAPYSKQVAALKQRINEPSDPSNDLTYDSLHQKIEDVYLKYIGRIVNAKSLDAAIRLVEGLRKDDASRLGAKDPHELAKVLGLKNFLTVFELVLRYILRREESWGGVSRDDFPYTDNVKWGNYTFVKLGDNDEILMWEEGFPPGTALPKIAKSLYYTFREPKQK